MRVAAGLASGLAAGVALLAGLLAACSSSPPSPASSPSWHEVRIDHPAGTRLALRDVTDCEGAWLLSGTVVDGSGDTRPLVLHGDRLAPVTTSGGDLYAHHAIITTSACRGATVVLLGTKSGGAHGMPRTSTFVGDATAVRDVRAPFELFAGPDQLSVRHFA